MRTILRGMPRLLTVLSLSLILAACGGDAGADKAAFSSEVVAQQVEVSADPTGALKWTKSAYQATAGDVTFVVKNPGAVQHNFVVEGNGVNVKSPVFKGNSTNNYTLKGLKPGEYQIICTVAGHREAGMVAKLTVR